MKPVDPRLLRYARATRVFLAGTVALGLVGAVLVVAQATLLADLVVGGFQRGEDTGALGSTLMWLAGVSVGRALVAWLTELCAHRSGAAVTSQLRNRLLVKATALGPGWLTGQRSGELTTLATRGIDALDDYFARYLPQLGLAAVVPAVVLARIVLADWISALTIALTLPLIPLFMVLVGWATRARMDRQWRLLGRLSGHFLDVVAGLPTLKVFGRAKAQADSIRAITGDYRRATLRTLRIAFLSSFVLELLATISVALVAVDIGLRLVHGELSLRTGLLVLILAPEAYLPLRQVGAQYHAAAEGLAAAEQVFEVLETAPAKHGTAPAPDLRTATLRVAGLTVRNGGTLAPTSFTLPPGETLAVTGPSGVGKSTLLRALLGFAPAAEGRITLEPGDQGVVAWAGSAVGVGSVGAAAPGEVVELGDIEPASWHRQIAWVPQHPHLFPGTVAENVRLVRPDASDAEVEAALADAGVLRFAGPDEVIGEDGTGLSAGQRQRIAVARAFLADRPLVLLDEPTANLDGDTEAALIDTLRRLARGRTVVLVAHRPALLALADRVLRLEPAQPAGPGSALPTVGTAKPVSGSEAEHAVAGARAVLARQGVADLGASPAVPDAGAVEPIGSGKSVGVVVGSRAAQEAVADLGPAAVPEAGAVARIGAGKPEGAIVGLSAGVVARQPRTAAGTSVAVCYEAPRGAVRVTAPASPEPGQGVSGGADTGLAGEGAGGALGRRGLLSVAAARGFRGRFAAACGLGALALLSAVGLMATSGWLISRASQQPPVLYLMVAVTATRAFGIGRAVFRYGERLVAHDAVFRALAGVRVAVYRRLERLAPAGLRERQRGDLLSRLVSDVDAVQDHYLRWLQPAVTAGIVVLACAGFAGWLLPAAGVALAAGLLAAGVAVPLLAAAAARRTEARLAPARGELSARVLALFNGTAELTVAGALERRRAEAARADRTLTAVAARSAAVTALGAGLATLVSGLTVTACGYLGVRAVAAHQLSGVALAALLLLPVAAFEAVTGMPLAAQQRQRSRRAAERVHDVLAAPLPVREPEHPAAPPASPFPLELRDLTARHPGRTAPALDGVDLTLTEGRRVAVVGASGAGKTTLAHVLLRFLDAESGRYTLGGRPAADCDGDDVRRLVGLCAQDAHVFDSTVRENLRLARPGADDGELRDALAAARLDLDLDTAVGEHGARLSGGMRQRLALARALLAGFPVLVLDEPAEHLDLATADALTADLLAATRAHARTTVLITHRLAGLAGDAVDEIVVLDGGRVVQRGTFRELSAVEGPFRRTLERERAADTFAADGALAGAAAA